MIFCDLTDKTRNEDSLDEIVIKRMYPSFNNEWLVKSLSECSLLFLLQVERCRSLTFAGTEANKSSCQNSAADGHPEVDTPRPLNQQWTGAGLNRLDCKSSLSLPRIAPIPTGTGDGDVPAPRERERERERPPTRMRYEGVPCQCRTTADAKAEGR